MFKFITVAWSLWNTFRPVFKDAMFIIEKIKATNLTDVEARNAVKQELTDTVQKYSLKDVPDSKLNAGIEICYQVYLLTKKV